MSQTNSLGLLTWGEKVNISKLIRDRYRFYNLLLEHPIGHSHLKKPTPSSPVKIEERKAKEPLPPTDCCMSGCVNCVWDIYQEELDLNFSKYESLLFLPLNMNINPDIADLQFALRLTRLAAKFEDLRYQHNVS